MKNWDQSVLVYCYFDAFLGVLFLSLNMVYLCSLFENQISFLAEGQVVTSYIKLFEADPLVKTSKILKGIGI